MTTTVPMLKLRLRAPHQKYFLKNGQQVMGVTTYLGVFNKEAIPPWYSRMEREGILALCSEIERGQVLTTATLETMLPRTKEGKPQWYAVTKRDHAADLGTIAHGHAQAYLLGTTLDPEGLDPKMYEDALVPYGRFKVWWDSQGMTVKHSEHQMVSEKWLAGGTGDAFGYAADGVLEYWDLKAANPWETGYPYPEQIAQSAAYCDFLEELTGEHVGRIKVARIGKAVKDPGDLYPVPEDEREVGLALFGHAVRSYECRRSLGLLCKQAR